MQVGQAAGARARARARDPEGGMSVHDSNECSAVKAMLPARHVHIWGQATGATIVEQSATVVSDRL